MTKTVPPCGIRCGLHMVYPASPLVRSQCRSLPTGHHPVVYLAMRTSCIAVNSTLVIMQALELMGGEFAGLSQAMKGEPLPGLEPPPEQDSS